MRSQSAVYLTAQERCWWWTGATHTLLSLGCWCRRNLRVWNGRTEDVWSPGESPAHRRNKYWGNIKHVTLSNSNWLEDVKIAHTPGQLLAHSKHFPGEKGTGSHWLIYWSAAFNSANWPMFGQYFIESTWTNTSGKHTYSQSRAGVQLSMGNWLNRISIG